MRYNRNRSPFIALLALAFLCGCSTTVKPAATSQALSTGRPAPVDTFINSGWKFTRSDVPGAAETGFDDSAWQKIELPHTWNNHDGQDGGNDYYRGPAWYRRHLSIPAGGKSYFLRFDGVSIAADVFVNGRRVGGHHNAFGAFCFDITDVVKPGDNVLAVRADNTRFDDVPPLSGDFTVFGGMYRGVHLLALDDLCISPIDDASPGVYLKQSAVSDESADVRVTTKLLNRSSTAKTATIVCTVSDGAGNTVTSATTQQPIKPRDGADAVQSLHIDRPHLWNGRADPYLYHATVEVKEGDKVVDRIVQPLGLRTFSLDPNRGAFLNGKPYALHGVNRHQDRIDKGWAISQADQDEDFALIMEMGSTTIRLAHYQHDSYFYDLCDRGGLIVWAEACLVNHLNRTPMFNENTLQQLRELIKQNYNHPSILMWSLFNELEFGKPEDRGGWELVAKLNDLAHQLDDTRLTVGASNQPADHPANRIPDAIAYNGYWGWYFDKITDWPAKLDRYHTVTPDRCVGVSEYGVGGSVFMHDDPPVKPDPVGWWRSEEWQCEFHEIVWQALKERPWIWGQYIWNMFDFAVDSRHEGDHLGRNDKGMVTYDRKTKKDAFYFYKANWNDEPVVYITSRRFAVRPPGRTIVKVYSNAESVTLFLNGRSLGAASGDDIHRFTWNVSLEPGENKVKAVGTHGGKELVDEITWRVTPGASTRRYATPGMIMTTEQNTGANSSKRAATTRTEKQR